MNWKQTLNPWGYARGLEIAIEAANGTIDNLTVSYGALHLENIDLLGQVSSLNELLRIADERADKNPVACDAAHDDKPVDIVWAEPSEVGNAIKTLRSQLAPADTFQTNQPISFNERPVNTGTRPKKRTATAPGGSELHLKDLPSSIDEQAKAYSDHVKGTGK